MTSDTLIDFYCHISPARFLDEMNKVAPKLGNIAARLRGVRKIHDLDARFKEMDEFGDYRQVISLPNPPIEDFATPRPRPRAGAHRQRRHGGALPKTSRPLCRLRRRAMPHRRHGLGRGGQARHQPARRRRRADFLAARRPAARRTRVRAALCRHGAARPADLAASRPHRGDAGLCRRAEIALRNVVVFRLALRHLGRHGAAGVLRPVRPLSEPEDHHPPSRRHDPVLRRPHRPRPRRARPTHHRRGLFKNPAVAETPASRLHARLLRRHRDVRRRRPRAALRAANSSAPTRWCSPPTRRSARSSRRSTR